MRHRAVSTRPAAHPVVTSPHQWRTSAACLGEPLDLFFPTAVVGPLYGAQVAAAKAVCARCAVVAACRADALAHAPYGIAGGLTEAERSAVRTARRSSTSARGPLQHDTDIDPIMVDRIARSGRQPGATRDELAAAAVRLVESGQPIVQVAERLGLAERTVSTYAATARAAQQLVAS